MSRLSVVALDQATGQTREIFEAIKRASAQSRTSTKASATARPH
jgi:hypothetical protein